MTDNIILTLHPDLIEITQGTEHHYFATRQVMKGTAKDLAKAIAEALEQAQQEPRITTK